MNATLSATSLLLSAMEIGPQPHGVVRSVIFSSMQEGVQLMLDWICQFNSGRFSATNPCRYLFAVCLHDSCVQEPCLKEDGLMCTRWWRTSTIHETLKHTRSRPRSILSYRYRTMMIGNTAPIRVNTVPLISGRTEISASFIPETPCSCLSRERRCATKGKKRSIRSS